MVVFRIAPRILLKEYDAFFAILLDDAEFPKTYDEWLERAAMERERRRARGEIIKKLTVHPQEFADWCGASGLDPSLSTLGAFAVAKALGKG